MTNKEFKWYQGLAGKSFLTILLLFTCATILESIFLAYIEHKEQLKNLEKTITIIESTHMPLIANNLLYYDFENVYTQLKSIKEQISEICYISITDKDHKEIIASMGKPQVDSTKTRVLSQNVVYDNQRAHAMDLGVLEIHITKDNIYKNISKIIFSNLIISAIINIIFSMLIFILFYFKIGKPLSSLSYNVTTFDVNNIKDFADFNSINIPLKITNEIEQLFSSFQIMKNNLLNNIRKKEAMEYNLKTSEERLKIAQHVAKIGVWEINVETNEFIWNETMENIFGFNKGEFDGKRETYLKRIHPNDLKSVIEFDNQLKTSKTPGNLEYRIILPDLSSKWIMKIGECIVSNDSQKIIGICQDITERKKYEFEIENLKNRIEFILGATKTSLDIVDSDFNFVYIDPATKKKHGDINGRRCFEYYHNKRKVCENCCVKESLNTKDIVVKEHCFENFNNRKPIQVTCFPFQDIEGKWQAAEVKVDISQRKQEENEKEMLRKNLAEKNEELETLVNITSHDLRSPLVNIEGFNSEIDSNRMEIIEILQNSNISPEISNKLMPILEDSMMKSNKYIKFAITKMDSLIRTLLEMSRLRKLKLHIQTLNMITLIGDILKIFEYQIRSKNIKLKVSTLAFCNGDFRQIHQIFSNLIDNAIKYIDPNKSGEIHISSKEENRQVTYCIKDNGPGIPLNDQPKIFNLFFRSNTTNYQKGEGLGLAGVKRIVLMHNGKVWCESKEGAGSIFYVQLPLDIKIFE